MNVPDDDAFAVLPELTDANRHFWQGGASGELVLLRCADCGTWLHPPQPVCPTDRSKHLVAEAVSGKGTVASFTINHHQWLPGFEPPYVVALVQLAEQDELRLTSNIVGCNVEDVEIGMPVRVVFRHIPDPGGDIWLPLFEPDGGAGADR
jgi:uncharacterized OB-fold protein